MHVDILADGGFQIFHASKHAASNAIVGDPGKPAFHQVAPTSVGRDKVNTKSWTFREPCPDDRGFVGAVVIHDDMHFQPGRDLRFDFVQEMAKLLRAMVAVQLADHAAGF